ncbi:hypothetical protein [Aureispira anguillae]|uniref:Outer membrane protein beta-barrel domain-containing protein n=1 Tax=Aureispira anguillae TaxID=2864201 RepID=A0A915YIF1_9BACT|nr:hypothetical protein [Aureispira anguillae]BDS13635.1 hypothetical protein AsAng_0043740 [Aureispira anguillae]
MKYILYLTLFFLLNSSLTQAQVPGYQGKRFFIELGGTFFPNFGYPTAQNKGAQSFPFNAHTGHFTIKDRYSLALHYVLSRKQTIKLAYNYQVSGLNTTASTPSLFSGSNNQDYHNLFYQLHAHDFNVGFNLYGRSNANLAPLGFYWDLGFRFVGVNGVLRDQRVSYADNRIDNRPDPQQLAPLTHETFTFMFGVTAMWGYRTIIANRITFNIGIETTIFPQYMILASPIGGIPNPFSSTGSFEVTEYQKGVIRNIQDRYLLGVHIGVGALIF